MDKTILIVEDDFYIRDLFRIALSRQNYAIDTADDGEEALQKLKETVYDLILLDIMLPKMTGIDVLKTMRENNDFKSGKSPVIVTSNLGQEEIIKTAIELGAIKYILKSQTKIEDIINDVASFLQQQSK